LRELQVEEKERGKNERIGMKGKEEALLYDIMIRCLWVFPDKI